MEVKPIKQEYVFSVEKHTMRAVIMHENNSRQVMFYFNDRLVSQKTVPGGEYYTDDQCVSEIVDAYRKNNVGVYADLFNHHADKIHLTAKIIEFDISNYGITAKASAKIVKDFYEVTMTTEDGNDVISGKIRANNFSEVLEKIRMFMYFLDGMSSEASKNITLLSSDKIREFISWE